jgi:hypothetical protein
MAGSWRSPGTEVKLIYCFYIAMDSETYSTLLDYVAKIMPNVGSHHGVEHAAAVADAVRNAGGSDIEIAAAVLHDVDDRKFFPQNPDRQGDSNFANARAILSTIPSLAEHADEIVAIVADVSTYRGDSNRPVSEANLVRQCDQLEAIGLIGIRRCYAFKLHRGDAEPMHHDGTPRCYAAEDALALATPERLATYKRVGWSTSFIDHFYDKLLHIDLVSSANPWIARMAADRQALLANFVAGYWQAVEEDNVDAYMGKYIIN